jgi:tripartite-type tricarboxylate transporter receptor subunit TctC
MEETMRPTRRTMLAALAATAVPLRASAQSAYPNKPIRFILPFPAGSGTDTSARIVAKQLGEMTGQPVVVDNRAGGNGLIAAQAAATSPPDGHTVFVTTMTTQSVNPWLYKKLPYVPQDFVPVTRFALSPMVLIVRPTDDQPKSLAELAALAKKKPGGLSYASGNTSSRLAAAVFLAQVGATGTHVPYKGTPQGITDLIAGQVDFFCPDLSPAVPLIQQGRLRGLGVTGPARVATLPGVPTMAEGGYPVGLITWSGAFLPPGTPVAIADQLEGLLRRAVASDEYQKMVRDTGTISGAQPRDQFAAFVKDELGVWGDAVRAAGIEPE